MAAGTWFLVILIFQVVVIAKPHDVEKGSICGPTGAARCDPSGRYVSVCLGSRGWKTVADCSERGQICLHGSCRPEKSNADSSTEKPPTTTCGAQDVGKLKCSKDCSAVGICRDSTWEIIYKCSEEQECYKDKCETKVPGKCPEAPHMQCFESGKYPVLKTCTEYFECTNVEEIVCSGEKCSRALSGDVKKCEEGLQFNACIGKCDIYSTVCYLGDETCRQVGDVGQARGNPSLYYTCLQDGGILWQKCTDGTYNTTNKACTETPNPCESVKCESERPGGGGGDGE